MSEFTDVVIEGIEMKAEVYLSRGPHAVWSLRAVTGPVEAAKVFPKFLSGSSVSASFSLGKDTYSGHAGVRGIRSFGSDAWIVEVESSSLPALKEEL